MEPRFTIHSKRTQEEFVKYNHTLLFEVWRIKRTIIVSNIALLAMLVTSVISDNWHLALALLVVMLFINWYFFWGVDKNAARVYKRHNYQDQDFDFFFYEDRYESTSDDGTSSLPYAKLHKIIETETNFYIMHGATTGTIIQKESCPSDFINFIHDIKARYKL